MDVRSGLPSMTSLISMGGKSSRTADLVPYDWNTGLMESSARREYSPGSHVVVTKSRVMGGC